MFVVRLPILDHLECQFFLFTCLSYVIVGPKKLYVNQMLCDDCNATTLCSVIFNLFLSGWHSQFPFCM
jgi:hypothetical protein